MMTFGVTTPGREVRRTAIENAFLSTLLVMRSRLVGIDLHACRISGKITASPELIAARCVHPWNLSHFKGFTPRFC